MQISRRVFSLLVAGGPLAFAFEGSASPGSTSAGSASVSSQVLRGKLVKDAQGRPALQAADGRLVPASGDEETSLVLRDTRLAGSEIEVIGAKAADGSVAINPIHLAALWAYKDGKRKRVTYWCDVCAIRTYSPGLCWCCREETELDLRDPDTVEGK